MAQSQLAGASTISTCAPVLDSVATDCPEASVLVTAGVPVADEPAGTTEIWNDVPAVGAGVHWNAQPICQLVAVMANVGLVQFP